MAFFKKYAIKLNPFFDQQTRRKTFTSWPYQSTDICNVKLMAEAGFVFTGSAHEPDAVECFYCRKNLDGWDIDDNPWIEHLKHAPKCAFAKLQKPITKCTIEEFSQLLEQYEILQITKRSEKSFRRLDNLE